MRKKVMSILLVICLIVGLFSGINFTIPVATAANKYDGYTSYNIEKGDVNITQSGSYHIYGTGTETTNKISVNGNITVDIILENVNIACYKPSMYSAFELRNGATTVVRISGNNSLISGYGAAGMSVPAGTSLILTSIDGDNSTNGTLHAENSSGMGYVSGAAGIGANGTQTTYDDVIGTVGNITINGGTITAVGKDFAAGIGGAYMGTTGHITINGGNVTATSRQAIASGGGLCGAGIGGGVSGSVQSITINGGKVNAKSAGVKASPGIGAGYHNNPSTNEDAPTCGTITITGGEIWSSVCEWSDPDKGVVVDKVSIGQSYQVNEGTIHITGGSIYMYNEGVIYPTYTGNGYTPLTGYKVNFTIQDSRLSNGSKQITTTVGTGDDAQTFSSSAKVSNGVISFMLEIATTKTGKQPVRLEIDSLIYNTTVELGVDTKITLGNPYSITIYDGQITDGAKSAEITIGDTKFKAVGNSTNGTTTLNFYGMTLPTEAVSVKIVLDGYTYNITHDFSTNSALTIGEQLDKMSLLFYFEINANTTYSVKSITVKDEDGNSLNSQNLVTEKNLTILNSNSAKLDIYLPVGSGYTISMAVNGINNGNTITKTDVENSNGNSETIMHMETSASFELDLAKGDIVFQNNVLTYYDKNSEDRIVQKTYNIVGSQLFIIKQTSTSSTANRITVKNQSNLHLVLAGVTMHDAATETKISGIDIQKSTVELTLMDNTTNTITYKGEKCTAIHVPDGSQLTINGNGSLTVTSGKYSAGIGGTYGIYKETCGIIKIQSGTINATGGQYGAGIGNGDKAYSGGKILIEGGNVTAKGGYHGAGIGSGGSSDNSGAEGSIDIEITGGIVNATGNVYGAGIGGGNMSYVGNIKITGGTVRAQGGTYGAGIGRGYTSPSTVSILIEGGKITAIGGSTAAGIGGGNKGGVNKISITIRGGEIDATGEVYAAGIGGGYQNRSNITIKITGGTIKVSGGSYASGIGNGYDSSGVMSIFIQDNAHVFHNKDSMDNLSQTTVNEVYGGTYRYAKVEFPLHVHVWSEVWTSNETAHWHECSEKYCDVTDNTEKYGYTTHTQPTDDENCLTAVTCTTCDYVFVVAQNEHSFTNKASSQQVSSAYDCQHKAVYKVQCDNCEVVSDTDTVEVGDVGAHKWNSQWEYDKTSHWHTCSISGCGATSTSEAHRCVYTNSSADTILESCQDCDYEETIQIIAPVNLVYDGTEKEATVTYTGTILDSDDLKVTYIKDEKIVTQSKDAGTYTASITLGEVTAQVTYTIAKQIVDISNINIPSKEYNGKTLTADIEDTDFYTVSKNLGGIHVGEYDVELTLKDFNNYKWSNTDSETITLKFEITNSINGWTVKPKIDGWTYGDVAKDAIGTSKYGTVTFTYYDSEKNQLNDKPINAGDYYMVASVSADGDNYAELVSEYISFTIAKKEITIQWNAPDSLEFNGEAKLPTAFVREGLEGNDTAEIVVTLTKNNDNVNVGSFTFYATGISNSNYKLPDDVTSPTYTITARPLQKDDFSAHIDGLVYNESSQCPMVESLNNLVTGNDYSVSYENNINAGIDTAKIIITGKNNASGTIEILFSIAKADPIVIWPKNLQGNLGEKLNTVILNDTKFTWDNPDEMILCGDNEYSMTYTPVDTANYNILNQKIGVYGRDVIAPTGEIEIGTNKWNTFLNTITFGLFFKETQQVEITANDVGLGVDTVSYFLSEMVYVDKNEVLTDNTISWKNLNLRQRNKYQIDIQPNAKVILYVKISDKAGNVTVIRSNGMVIDEIVPVFIGIEDGKTYCSAVEVIVQEEYLDKVTVDGNEVTVSDNKFIINPAEGVQTVSASDKAGNIITYAVTVYNGHHYIYENDGEDTIVESCQFCDYNASAQVIAPNNPIYDGTEKEAVVAYTGTLAGGNNLDITYVKDENNVIQSKDAGTYIASIALGGKTAQVIYEIEKQTVAIPTIPSKEYNGETLIANIEDTVLYRVEENFGGIHVGKYDVVLKLKDSNNYKWSETDSATITLKFEITKSTNEWNAEAEINGWTYGDIASEATATSKYGTVVFTYYDSEKNVLSDKPTNAGNYFMVASVLADGDNYDAIVSEYVPFTIAKKAVTIQWNAPDSFEFNGEAKLPSAFVNEGLEENDTAEIVITLTENDDNVNVGSFTFYATGISNSNYKLSGDLTSPTYTITARPLEKEDFSAYIDGLVYSERPQCPTVESLNHLVTEDDYSVSYENNINAGTDTAKIIITGKNNASGTIEILFSIEKAEPIVAWPENLVGNQGDTLDTVVLSDSKFAWDNAEDIILYGNHTYTMTYTPDDTENYKVIKEDIIVYGLDVTAPTAQINIGTNKWNTFMNNITFGLFFDKTQTVIVNAEDTESGIKEISYYLANEALTIEKVKKLADNQWTLFVKAFDINPEHQYVIYVRVSDYAGNVTYINSDGLVLDKTEPIIQGIQTGMELYGDAYFTVEENYLDSVIIDGSPATPVDGKYQIPADNAEHTVIVIDKTGHQVEYKVTVYKNYTVSFIVDGKEVSVQQIGYGKDAILPELPEKEGYTAKWDIEGKEITSDMTITAIYTEIPKVEAPETGDNARLWMWMILLIISGMSFVATAIHMKKRYVK